MDVKTRKTLTLHKVTYRNQCFDRIYVPWRNGGLGLVEINQVTQGPTTPYLKQSKEIKNRVEHPFHAICVCVEPSSEEKVNMMIQKHYTLR